MYRDVVQYVKDCPPCQVAKGPYIGPKTQLGSVVTNGPLELLCVDFTTMDPSRDGKKNVLVLTDAFSKFSQAFVTPDQRPLPWQKYLSMEYLQGYIVTKADLLRILFWSIYIPCMGFNSPQPHLTTHVVIPPVRGLTICSTIY